jgi:hypothetical protein
LIYLPFSLTAFYAVNYFGFYSLFSIGKPASFQALVPPTKAYAFVIPFSFNLATRPALVCSLGQEQ